MSYPLRNSPHYKLPRPAVQSCRDDTEYFRMDELNNAKRNRIWERMEQNRPELYHMIQNDAFIAALITQMGAQILIPRQ